MVVWYEVGFGTEVDWPIRCEAEHVYVTSSNRLRFNICSSWQTETESLCCAKGEEEFFFHKHITNTNNPNVSLLILAKERTARERMKINHTALAALLAAAVLKTSQGFVPPVNRQSIAPLRVTTSLTDTTASPPPPTLQDFDSVTVPDFPELGRDGIYHIQNSNQHK